MAVKFAGAVVPDLNHWAHYHAEQWSWLEEIRKIRPGRARGARVPLKHCYHKRPDENPVIQWPLQYGGNSAIFACLVAIALGYDEITLAGCPADDRGHFYEPPWAENRYSGFDGRSHEKSWKYCRDNYFFGKVKSLSGNTKTWLS